MRARCRFASWIVVAVGLIVAETLVVYRLRRVAPETSVGVAYLNLVGVLVVSSVWALALGVRERVVATAGAFACGARSRGAGERR
jgi:hypothetical protein